MKAFAERWIDNWNRRDVDALLVNFTDDIVLVSPVAAYYIGRPVLHGKAEIRAYWLAALQRVHSLRFELYHAVWDARYRELVVIYLVVLNGDRRRACEVMTFNAEGRQTRAEAMFGSRF